MMCTTAANLVGVELSFEKSGEHLRRGTSYFVRLLTPRLDSFYTDDLGDDALLPD
jgi:hypothetical protein